MRTWSVISIQFADCLGNKLVTFLFSRYFRVLTGQNSFEKHIKISHFNVFAKF